MDRLIIDSSVLIAGERGELDPGALFGDEDDVAIAAVTVAELEVGVALADKRYRARRRAYVDAVRGAIPAIPYDEAVADIHAGLIAHTVKTGDRRSAHDLIIAATAASTGRTLVTLDRRGFEGLPGVRHTGG
ncbi:MAG: PIN domain-containing protein [Acidimicrobiia bacterium]|nr:PIN domain-containing protein [Acidimicrobiia bacterium]MBT8213749.1 PIN domain-containing protein [Acidimicrobiia bacterium]NNK90826.1 PIN domain-containing protein [Acidimicrobiia bacterium]